MTNNKKNKIENAIGEIKNLLRNNESIASSIGMEWSMELLLYKPLIKKGIDQIVVSSAIRFLIDDLKYIEKINEYSSNVKLTLEGWQWIFGKININNDVDKIFKNSSSPKSEDQALIKIRDYIWDSIAKLSPRDQKILEMRFGLVDGVSHTLEEVGQEFLMLRKDIKNIENNALNKISKFDEIKNILSSNNFSSIINSNSREAEFLKNINIIYNKNSSSKNSIKKEKKLVTTTFLSGDGKLRRITSDSIPSIGVKEMSEEITNILVDMKGEDGAMFGIFGRWGRGKTYLMGEIKKQHIILDHFHVVDFNAWKYQDTPAIWAYLYEELSKHYYVGNWLKRVCKRFKINIKRYGFWSFLTTVVPIILGIAWSLVSWSAKIERFIIILGFLGIVTTVSLLQILLVYIKYKNSIIILFKKYTTKLNLIKYLGLQHEIQEEIKILLKSWLGNKNKSVLLFIDDIDRCSEDKIIQVVDALKVMLDDQVINKKIVVVAAIDERILKRAIEFKYRNITKDQKDGDGLSSAGLMQEYMDKLFLCGLRLGNLTNSEIVEIADNFCELSQSANQTLETELNKKQLLSPQQHVKDIPDNNKPLNQEILLKHQMSIKERDSIYIAIQKIKDITPRQISIFAFRYLLARNILRVKNINYDYKHLSSLMVDYINNGEINTEDKLIASVIEMVIPY